MKRNLEILREVLLAIEQQAPKHSSAMNTGQWTADSWTHHIALLIDAGYVRGAPVSEESSHSPGYVVDRLTMQGSDFLAAIRNDHVFVAVLRKIEESVDDAPLSVVRDLAENHIRRRIFRPDA